MNDHFIQQIIAVLSTIYDLYKPEMDGVPMGPQLKTRGNENLIFPKLEFDGKTSGRITISTTSPDIHSRIHIGRS